MLLQAGKKINSTANAETMITCSNPKWHEELASYIAHSNIKSLYLPKKVG